MKSFSETLKEQAEREANQKYFNLLSRMKWLPAIRMKDTRTSERPRPQRLPLVLQMVEGKKN